MAIPGNPMMLQVASVIIVTNVSGLASQPVAVLCPVCSLSRGCVLVLLRPLPFCSVAQTALHPANVIKTLLQTKGSFGAILPLTWTTLARGAGAQFLLSLPNGALHFAVLEVGSRGRVTMTHTSFDGGSRQNQHTERGILV